MTTHEVLYEPELYDPDEEWSPSKKRIVSAWMTHLVTASSAVWGLLAILAITNAQWIEAFWWMAAAVFIDSFDGMLARRVDVKRVLPQIDGALLDNIVDYLNYVFVPAYFLYASGLLPNGFAVLGCALVLLSSAYQFSQSDAKTDDHFFKGFPSYWNVVVFYMFMLGSNVWLNLFFIVLFAVLVFVPIKYIYPSRTTVQPKIVMGWGALWGISCLAMLVLYPDVPLWLMVFSLAYVVYYHAISLYAQFWAPARASVQ
jgi:phosphatidylcholine synthase